jgi:hypothetical protein
LRWTLGHLLRPQCLSSVPFYPLHCNRPFLSTWYF